jgi:hypothetical protein
MVQTLVITPFSGIFPELSGSRTRTRSVVLRTGGDAPKSLVYLCTDACMRVVLG